MNNSDGHTSPMSADDAKKKQALQFSFVVDGAAEEATCEKDLCPIFTWTQILAPLYAVVLVIFGLAGGLSQATRRGGLGEFDMTGASVGFRCWLYIGSSAYLISMLIYIHVTKKNAKKKHADENSNTNVVHNRTMSQSTGNSSQTKDTLSLRVRHVDSGGQKDLDTISSSKNKSDQIVCSVPVNKDDPVVCSIVPTSNDSGNNSMLDFSDSNSDFDEQMLLLQRTSSQAHEGSSFYLRLGLLLFGIGHMIAVCLELQSKLTLKGECKMTFADYHPWIWHLLFVIIQTFFLFKNTSLHLDSSCQIARFISRFGIQHLLATNLIIWIEIVIREIWEAYNHATDSSGEEHLISSTATTNCSSGQPVSNDITPYLMPFILEYSLIAMAICAGYYYSMNIRVQKDLVESLKKAFLEKQEHNESAGHEELFHKAHTGLFLGVVHLTCVLIAIILFFFYDSDKESNIASYIDHATDVVSNIILLIVTCLAIYIMSQFKFTYARNNSIDAVLLIMSMTGFIVIELFYIASTTYYLKWPSDLDDYDATLAQIALCDSVTTIVQGTVQTCLIFDAMQRSAKTKDQRENKPGRGVITFLVIANVSQWLLASLLARSKGTNKGSYPNYYYGSGSWSMVHTLTEPLALFYRFHSSVCLADVWIGAYETSAEPDFKVL